MFRCRANTMRPTATTAAATTEITMARRRLRVGFIAWRRSRPAAVFLARDACAEFAQVAAAPGQRGQRVDQEDDEEDGDGGPHIEAVRAQGEIQAHAPLPSRPASSSRTQPLPPSEAMRSARTRANRLAM